MALTVNDENFEGIINTNLPVILDLGATWCGPCQALAPIIEEMASDYEGRAVIGKVDVDEAPGIAAKYRVRNIPTVLFLKGGELKDKTVGAVAKQTLVDKLNAIL